MLIGSDISNQHSPIPKENVYKFKYQQLIFTYQVNADRLKYNFKKKAKFDI